MLIGYGDLLGNNCREVKVLLKGCVTICTLSQAGRRCDGEGGGVMGGWRGGFTGVRLPCTDGSVISC